MNFASAIALVNELGQRIRWTRLPHDRRPGTYVRGKNDWLREGFLGRGCVNRPFRPGKRFKES